MRPLNRPMFRYGGPIKEGIMSGMQDRPGYQRGKIVGGLISKIPGGSSLIEKGANLNQNGGMSHKPDLPIIHIRIRTILR